MVLIVVLVWATIGFAILPFVLSDINVSFIDAFFEATSGITTTGYQYLKTLINAVWHTVSSSRITIYWGVRCGSNCFSDAH